MSTAEERSVTDSIVRRGTLVRGALAGACAWLVGYLVAYVWQSGKVTEHLEVIGFFSQLSGEPVSKWKAVAWFFLNAHYVGTKAPTLVGGTQFLNFVTREGSVPGLLLVLPPVVLVVAGAAVAYGRSAEIVDGASTGATVAVGYLPLSLLAAFLTTYSFGGSEATVAPDPVTAILLAGVVYPAVFGALGGVGTAVLE
jgi:hypothetical protein